MDYNKIKNNLLVQFPSDEALLKQVRKLNANFTSNRERIGEYLEDDVMVAAYAGFYLPTNFPKLAFIFNWLQEHTEDFRTCDFYDIGMGPATYSLAWLSYFSPDYCGHIDGVDMSALMREQAVKMFDAFYPNFENFFVGESAYDLPVRDHKKLVFFGHSLNEMQDEYKDLLASLNPDYVLFLEPGTKESFQKVLEARDYLKDCGYHCQFPCPSNADCPMSGEDWCHQYLYLQHDQDIERLCQKMKIDRRNNPAVVHLYSKERKNSSQARVIRSHPESKFGLEWQVCEGENQLQDIETFKRGLSKDQIKELAKIRPGDSIEYELVKELKNQKLRGKIKN